MNTVFEYLYRDASNYKQYGEVVFQGTLSDALKKPFAQVMGKNFVAAKVNVPEVFFDERGDDDHAWHEVVGWHETDESPTDAEKRNIKLFAAQLMKHIAKLEGRL